MENGEKEENGDLDTLFAMMAVQEPPEHRNAQAIQAPVAEVSKPTSGSQPPILSGRSQQLKTLESWICGLMYLLL